MIETDYVKARCEDAIFLGSQVDTRINGTIHRAWRRLRSIGLVDSFAAKRQEAP